MERTIKLFFTFLFIIILAQLPCRADDDAMLLSTLITPQNVNFNICTRTYVLSPEKLFYMAIASANANRFEVEEIQSKTGYILFNAVNKQYLASVVKVDDTHSMLKITIETGRKNQIRVALASKNIPILGDWKYGEKSKVNRLYLHANRLKIYYPVIKKEILFETSIPMEFKKLMQSKF